MTKEYLNYLSKVNAVINAMKELTNSQDKHDGLQLIFDKMVSQHGFFNSQTLHLAFEIKKALDEETSQNLVNSYVGMKNSFPKVIRVLIWGDKMKLRNRHYGEYLYAPDYKHVADSERRYIFTYTDSSWSGTIESLWKVESDDGIDFYFKNHYYNEYLYYMINPGLFDDKKRRNVRSWRLGDKVWNGAWKIEIIDTNKIIIRSSDKNEYLFASNNKYNSLRRYVYTWIPQDYEQQHPTSQGFWEVEEA